MQFPEFSYCLRLGFVMNDSRLCAQLLQLPLVLEPAIFSWLLPILLGYRRGAIARIGTAISIAVSMLLASAIFFAPAAMFYSHIRPLLLGVVCVYAGAGIAVCAVGIFDRKRIAIWAMCAVLVLLGAMAMDVVLRFFWTGGPQLATWGFLAFWGFLGIGCLGRRPDRAAPPDLRAAPAIAANNQTRRSRSIPRKLIRDGRIHLLPAFYLLDQSDLGHEGITHSGSYRFADHLYRAQPSGRNWVGKQIDALILATRAAKAFRLRYKVSQREIKAGLAAFGGEEDGPLRILAVPCGLPRDLTELADSLALQDPASLARLEYTGMDIDPGLLRQASAFTANCPLSAIRYHQGNALLRDQYPSERFHFAVSTGLGEFLDDAQLDAFYGNVYDRLLPGGSFYTSATHAEARSELLLEAFELHTHYRTAAQLQQLLGRQRWRKVRVTRDETGLQSFVVAVK